MSTNGNTDRPSERVGPAMNRAMFSHAKETWATPSDLYAALDQEFSFTLDPCPLRDPSEAGLPLFGTDGLSVSWKGQRVFCNPPYSRHVRRWLEKAREADLAVYLLPARTDTRWWHDLAAEADEIRFLRGRLRFGGARAGAPFPSVLVIFRTTPEGPRAPK
jgi:phage N-6-adenine-methyltransferase